MILPNKYLTEDETLIGYGALILSKIQIQKRLSDLWEELKKEQVLDNYELFVLTLDMLFILGLIDVKNNYLFVISHDS